MDKSYIAQFNYKKWHSLTDLPKVNGDSMPASPPASKNQSNDMKKCKVQSDINQNKHNVACNDILSNISDNAQKLLYNIAINLELSVRERFTMLNISARVGENAKHELITRGLVIESVVGKKKYLIPQSEVFEAFGLLCPYKNKDFVEHSFFMYIAGLTLKKDPKIKSVSLEYKIGTAGHTADIVTQDDKGVLISYELTHSKSNIVQNCLKYSGTGFSKIIFLCKKTDTLKAVRSTVLKEGLPLELLSKIDFMLLSDLLKRKRSGGKK